MPPIRRRDYLSIRNYDTFNNTIYWNINVVCHLIAESAITIKTAIPKQYAMKRSQILKSKHLVLPSPSSRQLQFGMLPILSFNELMN